MSEPGKRFIFDGNDLSLDFINTYIVSKGEMVDLLGDFGDVVSWLLETGCIDPGTAERMINLGHRQGGDELEKVREFRAQLKDIVEAVSEGKPLRISSIDPVNRILSEESSYSRLILIDGKARLITYSPSAGLNPRLPIAKAFAELLVNKDLSLVRKCSNPECVLFFYDESKNHGRRWCSMDRCGNRMKAALHYRRKRAERNSS